MAEDGYALRHAAREGHGECVRILASGPSKHHHAAAALRLAAGNGHEDCIRALSAIAEAWWRTEPEILRTCAERATIGCVEALLASVDRDGEAWGDFVDHVAASAAWVTGNLKIIPSKKRARAVAAMEAFVERATLESAVGQARRRARTSL